jgi:signal transduction histidine kinase
MMWLMAAAWVFSLAVIVENYHTRKNSFEQIVSDYQYRLQQKEAAFFRFVENNVSLVERAAGNQSSQQDLALAEAQPFAFFVYGRNASQGPLFWNTNQVAPAPWVRSVGETGQMFKYGNGYYEVLQKTVRVGNAQANVVGLVLLYREYFINNSRLQKSFPDFRGMESRLIFNTAAGTYKISNALGEPFFYLEPALNQPVRMFSWVALLLQFISLLLLIVCVSSISNSFIRRDDLMAGFMAFAVGFTLIWFSVREIGFPINLDRLAWLERSDTLALPPVGLLRLLQNALFVFWLGVFVTTQAQRVGKLLTGLNYVVKAFIALILVAAATTTHFAVVEKLCLMYLSSTVAFDFNNFFSLDYTTGIAFLVLFMMVLAHLMLIRFFARSLLYITAGNVKFVMIAMLAGGLLSLSASWFLTYKLQLLFSLIWLIGLVWFICRYPRAAFPISSGRIVVWLFMYSLSIGVLLSNLSSERIKNRLYDIGKKLLMQNDQTSDYLIRFASGGIRKIDWINAMNRSRDSATGVSLRDSLVNRHFGGYLDRFVTRIYFFDEKKEAINNPGEEGFETLNTLFENSTRDEGFPWVASFEESFDRFGYIMHFMPRDADGFETDKHVFVVVRSVVQRNILLAPELFRQIQDFAVDLPPGFSYAWYRNNRLVEQYRNYPFPSVIQYDESKRQNFWLKETDNAYETWLDAGERAVLVVAGNRNLWLALVSMVAYMFVAFLALFITVRLIGGLLQGKLFSTEVFRPLSLTIGTQIRITIVSILGVSFVIVAYITISFFINQYNKTNEERLSKNAAASATELSQLLPGTLSAYGPEERRVLTEKQLQQVARNLNIDINLFDTTGTLLGSTQGVLFLKEVISPQINPEAFYKLTKGGVYRYLKSETIGNLNYKSIYQPVRSTQGMLLGFLQIPYFATQNELEQEISNFVVILINIIAFVFLISGGLALIISGTITRSFAVVAEKMNHIRLSEKNERIEWTAKNEIGTLVEQYNRMVDQLELSAARLAQNERELAWREMARQVAHEIKNPLTPMKLSLQFLQKAIKENNGNVGEISARVAGNLVSQIDHLSKIAYEFSQFANLGNTNEEAFDLHDVLRELNFLYQSQEGLVLHWHKTEGKLMVMADKTQLNRLFTNLIKNATEAIPSDRVATIHVIEKIKDHSVVLEIRDNGDGIPAEIQPKLFTPNFTTKSSGTGLGLAICKGIVEKARGNIWFITNPGRGTSFFVELPLLPEAEPVVS